MSFSEEIKNEILETKNKKCCVIPLRYGELITESKDITVTELKKLITKSCCKKAFLKGVFLGSGCLVNPESEYHHFEVSLKGKTHANYVAKTMEGYGLYPKITKRNQEYVVYIKDAEQISTMLRVFEANKAVFKFEDVRINKSIKNDINRTVNCETANLNKIAKASYKHIEAINKLKADGRFDTLNAKLREIAELREDDPAASLEELAAKCSYDISKSGVYHRLNKIVKIAEEE